MPGPPLRRAYSQNFLQSFQPSPKKSILSQLCCKSPVWVFSFGIFPALGRDFLAVIQTPTFTPSPHSGFNGFRLHLHAKSQTVKRHSSFQDSVNRLAVKHDRFMRRLSDSLNVTRTADKERKGMEIWEDSSSWKPFQAIVGKDVSIWVQ
uniref:Uncharacterized protein n=1 Tax=Magallana gigas TaxID=29159 RepID=A0A8W8L1E8_MAGGI